MKRINKPLTRPSNPLQTTLPGCEAINPDTKLAARKQQTPPDDLPLWSERP